MGAPPPRASLVAMSISVSIYILLCRTAGDFGSASDTVWPFFASLGCTRTSKPDLIRMDIVKKVSIYRYDTKPYLAMYVKLM